jgi:hypothetical protein
MKSDVYSELKLFIRIFKALLKQKSVCANCYVHRNLIKCGFPFSGILLCVNWSKDSECLKTVSSKFLDPNTYWHTITSQKNRILSYTLRKPLHSQNLKRYEMLKMLASWSPLPSLFLQYYSLNVIISSCVNSSSSSNNNVTIIAICYNMIYISYKLGGALLTS